MPERGPHQNLLWGFAMRLTAIVTNIGPRFAFGRTEQGERVLFSLAIPAMAELKRFDVVEFDAVLANPAQTGRTRCSLYGKNQRIVGHRTEEERRARWAQHHPKKAQPPRPAAPKHAPEDSEEMWSNFLKSGRVPDAN
jgi:hypothetical protein